MRKLKLRWKAFTLIELLVVVAIIALLISILLPSLSRARELSKRTVCLSNIRGVGQGMYIYAQDGDRFPAYAGTNTVGSMTIFNPPDRTGDGAGSGPSTTGVPSPTVDLWLLLRANNCTPKQFNCPSTTDTPDPAQDTTAYYDFLTSTNLSYAYQYQHSSTRQIIGTASEPNFPILADSNPYIKGGVQSALPADRRAQWRGNSTNHTAREVSNVLFVDGHGESPKDPAVGLPGRNDPSSPVFKPQDNIYSTHLANQFVDPGNQRPTATLCALGGRSDTCLVP
ncbi:MAG: prepilin-type N-terminal cleavage/methylation domain-containing protein [Phycisphaerae bacterium]|nr:prepilin-type N-terminal cleavage/methylation domain-containing protein [Phycisphaerae bacterium]